MKKMTVNLKKAQKVQNAIKELIAKTNPKERAEFIIYKNSSEKEISEQLEIDTYEKFIELTEAYFYNQSVILKENVNSSINELIAKLQSAKKIKNRLMLEKTNAFSSYYRKYDGDITNIDAMKSYIQEGEDKVTISVLVDNQREKLLKHYSKEVARLEEQLIEKNIEKSVYLDVPDEVADVLYL